MRKMPSSALRVAYKLMRIVWKVTKPQTLGARIVLEKEGRVLLVKHTYQDQWFIPGGRLKHGETYEKAVRRELQEEIGCTIETCHLLGVYTNTFEGKHDSIVVFYSNAFDFTGKKDNEIEQLAWFDLENLPGNTSKGSWKRVQEYIGRQYPVVGEW